MSNLYYPISIYSCLITIIILYPTSSGSYHLSLTSYMNILSNLYTPLHLYIPMDPIILCRIIMLLSSYTLSTFPIAFTLESNQPIINIIIIYLYLLPNLIMFLNYPFTYFIYILSFNFILYIYIYL